MNSNNESSGSESSFWYRKPAEHWRDGLPLANGRMGAMVYGGARVERIALSETTFWSGDPALDNNPPGSPAIFQQVRQHLLNREIDAANTLARKLEGRKLNYGTNLPFGNLRLFFSQMTLEERDYRRTLNLDEAVATVQYGIDQAQYQREVFVSAVHQVMVIRLTCSQPGKLTFRVALDGDEQPFVVCADSADMLRLDTQARENQHSDGRSGVSGHARLRVLIEGGTIHTAGAQLVIEQANAATLLLAMGATYGGNDAIAHCQEQIQRASEISCAQLRQAHVAEHQKWFRRATLDLGPNPHPDLAVNERIECVRQGAADPHLCALLFQFGRYLLIGSSRPDSPLPAHLQGAWNDNTACRIGWTCDYHLDINTQMNYWLAEVTNLSECHQPLLRWIEQTLVPSGRRTAQALYGFPGWVAHIFSNAWGFSAWGWSIDWGAFPTGGVWAAMHLWDHYAFTGDRRFLAERAYPILKEAAEFCQAYLVRDPRTGWLVSGAGNSPENAFLHEGKAYTVALGPTVDHVLIRELFDACIQASQALDIDADFQAALQTMRSQLPPYQVGKNGQIQEWLEDYDEAIPGHRHTSHLLGVYPFAQITPEGAPDLARAARTSVERRVCAPGYEEGAWSRNNMTLFYARLADSRAAYASLMTLLRVEAGDSLFAGTRLAPAHAYELDYNTGATAGIAEMLLHSHAGIIALLPALPDEWAEGSVEGLRARGGFEVGIVWRAHMLVSARVCSLLGAPCRVRSAVPVTVVCSGTVVPVSEPVRGVYEFATRSGGEYLLATL